MVSISEIAKNYPRSGIRVMFDIAENYPDAINLTVGQPNFETPEHIKESAISGIREGLTYYTPNGGIYELRQAVAKKYSREFDDEYSAENVMITIGGMEAIFLSLVTILNPGDEVIITDPGFSNYVGQISMAGGKAVTVPLYEEKSFKLQPEDLEKAITPRTKAVLLNYPTNPTGAVLDKEDVEALAEVVKKHNLTVISDEVYEKVMFDGHTNFSMAQIPEIKEDVIIINSLSKTYAMTGWRIGYAVAGKDVISHMPKLQEAVVSCVPGFVQKAAVDALTGSQDAVEDMVKHYKRRRDLIVNGLNQIPGFKCFKGSGAFYAFANIKAFGKTSLEFASELVSEAGVIGVPGSAFGKMGEGYMRFSYANSDENLNEAIRRIAEHVKKKY